MRGAALKGKTIRKVHQSPYPAAIGRGQWSVDAIEFTDGTFLRFVVMEHPDGGEYGVNGIYPAMAIAPAETESEQ